MATEISKEQLALLKKAFQAFDREKKGCIPIEMVGTILDMLGHKQSRQELQDIVSEVDADGSGELEFDEFCELASKFLGEEEEVVTEAMRQELRDAFRLYDKDGYGYITLDIMREILEELDESLSPEELDMMIDEIDADGSGTVDFEEFMNIMVG